MEDRKSTSGMVFDIGSGSISWGTKKQEVTALSTTEAEYIAVTSATCQGVWLKRMLDDCGVNLDSVVVIWCDNKSTIEIAKNPAHHGRTKYIDIRYHFIRSKVADGSIILKYCKSEDQRADIFTKPLPVKKHNHLRMLLGVGEFFQSMEGVVS